MIAIKGEDILNNQNDDTEDKKYGLLFGLIGAALLVWGLYWVFINYFLFPCTADLNSVYAARGQFGDMFGAVNALFSAFAFAGLIYAIILQRTELSEQRRQFTLSAKAQQKTYQLQLVKEAYDYIIRTHKERTLLFKNAQSIMAIKSLSALNQFKENNSELYEALREVSNCYHYIGFLMHIGLLEAKEMLFDEGGETMLGVWQIVEPVLNIERGEPNRGQYKRYFYTLINDLKQYRGTNV
jgi:hypothetical protein